MRALRRRRTVFETEYSARRMLSFTVSSLSFRDAANDHPARVALVADRVYDFASIAPRVIALSAGIRRAVPEDRYASIVGSPNVETIVRAWAAIEVGVPLVLLHPRWTDDERERFRSHHDAIPIDDVAEEAPVDPVVVDPNRTLAVFATSGSSGAPKGVALTRAAFIASARASAENLGWLQNDRWHLDLPLAHVGGFSILVRCLLARRAIALGGLDTIAARGATIVSVVPTQLARWFDADFAPPTGLRAMLVGGAAAPGQLLEEAARRRWPVLTTYGLTEACSQVATQRYGTAPDARVGAGLPLPGTEVRIEDEEILVRGPTLMREYTTPHVSPIVDGWLHTRDAGRLDDEGHLHVFGRRDGVLVTGGENVHPFEVEEALRAIEGVVDAVVFGVDDPKWGTRIVAAIVARRRPSRDELAHLARFKHPKQVAIVPGFAMNATNKIDRAAVAKDATPRLEDW